VAGIETSSELVVLLGEIRLNQVSFAYEPGRSLIKDSSFTTKPSRTIAIIGGTRIGNSTIVV